VSRGAELNDISQSAASQHIQELERDMDVALLDRSTRPLALTEAGKLYYDLCRDLLRRDDEFRASLGRLKGRVRVAAIYSVGLSEMSRLEEEFAHRYPDARLEVEYLRPEKVYEAVLMEQADIGLVSYPEPTKELAVLPWREEEMVVAATPSHPLAGRPVLGPADLAGAEFVAFDSDLPIRHSIDRYLRDHGVEVSAAMHFDNIPMMKEAVVLGTAISILPARIMQAEIAQGRLVAIPIEPRLFRPLGIVRRKKKQLTPAAQAFLELLQEHPEPEPVSTRTVTLQSG
jgi:DNA-binding transcriptional LysR family regulator